MQENSETKEKDLSANSKTNEEEVSKQKMEKGDTLDAYLGDLDSVAGEISDYSDKYEKTYKELLDVVSKAENFIKKMMPLIEAGIKGQKDLVDDLVDGKKKLKQAKSDYDDAKDKCDDKRETYNSLQKLITDNNDTVENLKKLTADVIGAEKNDDFIGMYLSILDLKDLLSEKKSKIKTSEEFKSDLFKAWKEWYVAEIAERECKEQKDTVKANLSEKQAKSKKKE